MSKRWMLVCALAAVGLIAAGCGDDDESTTDDTTTAELTKQEWIAQANDICAEGNARIDAGAQEVFSQGQPTPEEETAFVQDTLVPEVQSQVEEIRALPVPEGEEEQINAILDAAESGAEQASEDPTTLGSPDDPFAEANELSLEYGLDVCGG